MLEAIEKLLLLQDRDRKIQRARAELAHIGPERQHLKAKAELAQANLENARQRVKQIESDRKRLELDVDAQKQLIEKYSLQQFQTRKNEEYRALAHEIETCKATIIKIEDQEIELMEQTETGQKEVAQCSRDADEARKLMEELDAQLTAREANLRKEHTELERNREELAAAVDPAVCSRYERLLKSKGDNVVVGVDNGVCGGCHMRLPAQILVTCQGQHEIVSCTHCGRILYYTSDMVLAGGED